VALALSLAVDGFIQERSKLSGSAVAVAIAEMALARRCGALIDGPTPFGPAGSFFAEDQGLYVVTVQDVALLAFLAGAQAHGIEAEPIGRTIANRLIFECEAGDYCVSLDALRNAHEGFFPKLMGADAALA